MSENKEEKKEEKKEETKEKFSWKGFAWESFKFGSGCIVGSAVTLLIMKFKEKAPTTTTTTE